MELSKWTPDQLTTLSTDYYRYVYSQAILKIFENRLPGWIRTKALAATARLFITQASFRNQGDLILPAVTSPYYTLFERELKKAGLRNISKYTIQVKEFLNFYQQGIAAFPRVKSISLSKNGLIIDNTLVPIDFRLWSREKSLYNGEPTLMNYYLVRLFLLYLTIGIQTGYQYALANEITKDYDLELFASPFNFTLPNYCSLFPEVDQFFGSKGKYPECLDNDNYQRITANPPFINIFQNDLAKRVLQKLDESSQKGVFRKYLISMANWTDTEAYRLLSGSKYLKETFTVSSYINKITGQEIPLPSSISFLLETSHPTITPEIKPKVIQPETVTHHIYFRHGPRLNLSLDPPLKPESTSVIQSVGLKIHSLYGVPNSIVTSPYLRTRQTADVLSKIFSPVREVKADIRLSEKLNIRKRTGRGPPGNYDSTTISLSKLANISLPRVGESALEVKTRLSDHLASFGPILEETWFITHGYIIEALVELYGSQTPYHPGYLTALVIPRMNYNQEGFWFRLHYPRKTYTYQRQKSGEYKRTISYS